MTLKQALDMLPPEKKAVLMFAFEQQIPQYVELSDGKYLGVKADVFPNLSPETTLGDWSFGAIKR